MGFWKHFFTWWHDYTLGTAVYTRRHGRLVGKDAAGNRYFEHKDPGRRERWVLYNGAVEASRVPPEWHGWLHYTVDTLPGAAPPCVKPWEKEHVPNLTGTRFAYRPPGSLADHRERERATGDYEPWRP